MDAAEPAQSGEPIPPTTLTRRDALEGERTYTLCGALTTLGRGNSNDIILPDPMVSRRHCRIYWTGDRYVIEDLDSSNGTYLNNERIRIAFLSSGDTLQLGDQVLEFRLLS
ncbi:MAG TPA: FHA domain-containing protein [Chloroflexota bacterium]|nr:FHA domain-containing protein [Chloroflexota bacterium]